MRIAADERGTYVVALERASGASDQRGREFEADGFDRIGAGKRTQLAAVAARNVEEVAHGAVHSGCEHALDGAVEVERAVGIVRPMLT